jgi:hypothetical protein
MFDQISQVQHSRASIYQSDIVDAVGRLESGHLVQFVQYNARIAVFFDIHYDAHAFAVGFVVNIGNAIDFLVANQFCDMLD